ncbi:MAG: hypothetical protein P1S59_02855 [bacterium]|nr:hypothetical protein [bacterium]
MSRTYSVMNRSDRPSGQVVVEIKIPTPFCVPLEDEPEAIQTLVDAVLEDIRFTRMVDQVTIESYSPEILDLAKAGESDIPRMLAVDALQLLPRELIELYSDYKVQIIEKDSFGLTWGEVGIEPAPGYPILWLFRVPGYFPEGGGDALGNYIATLFATGSSIASLDKNLLFMTADPPHPFRGRFGGCCAALLRFQCSGLYHRQSAGVAVHVRGRGRRDVHR